MRVRFSLNYRELMDVQGLLARMAPLPERRVPGSDGAGEVVTVGPEVRRVRPGDRVATVFYPDWLHGPMPPDLRFTGRSARPTGPDGVPSCKEDELVLRTSVIRGGSHVTLRRRDGVDFAVRTCTNRPGHGTY
jgi:hypothetical protein